MKNEEQRIWNKSELEAHHDWKDKQGYYFNENSKFIIEYIMLGKSVQWCKDQGYTVTPEMIAKPLEETWTKTMDLRFIQSKSWFDINYGIKILQQKQISNLGNEKWVDVETVTI